ncbi:MAG: phosphate ABC transporter substrate-binding protein [Bacteroidetes bacterium]|nr:phosphate ABC transporter substrate-binding protein [Bacteroidota bacterium]
MNTTTYRLFRRVLLTGLVFGILVMSSSCRSKEERERRRGDKLKGTITLSGAFALYPLAVRWAEVYHTIHPKVVINISAGGAGKGMADALSGMVDLGMFSKEISPQEAAQGAWWVAVAKDAVLPTISDQNPYLDVIKSKGLSKDEFRDIFLTEKIRDWKTALGVNGQDEIHVYSRSDACGAAEVWAKYLDNKKQEDLVGIGLNGDPGVADALRKDPLGIGYNNLNFTYDLSTRVKYKGIEVIPIDLNNNDKIDPEESFYATIDDIMHAIQTGAYPSPPARKLYLVSKGKPEDQLVVDFLHWILTEGQKYVQEAGYINLPDSLVSAERQKME